MKRRSVAIALVHHPVLDRRGDRVTTAVTNLDIHDLARTSRTYDVDRVYVVTPLAEQQQLVARILDHWRQGHGAVYNPKRAEALKLVAVVTDLQEALADWQECSGQEPWPVLTGASTTGGISFRRCRELLGEKALLLVLGTGWGLAPDLFEQKWTVLEPIVGAGDDYNHLPVRSAAAIMLDRLLGATEI